MVELEEVDAVKQRFRPRREPRVEWIDSLWGGYPCVYVTDGVLAMQMPVIPELETEEWAMREARVCFEDTWHGIIRPRASRMRSAYRAKRGRR